MAYREILNCQYPAALRALGKLSINNLLGFSLKALMKRTQPLIRNCRVVAVAQSKAAAQPVIGDIFEPFENGCLRYFPARNQPVAVIAVRDTEDAIGGQSLPKGNVIQRVQPFVHIRQIFKNNHGTSVPHLCFETQFWPQRSPQDGK